MIIYASHGVVENIIPQCLAHRNLVSSKSLLDFALEHKDEIIDLDNALHNKTGIVITIDDNTKASYDAVKLLTNLQIPCVWFVNSLNLATNIPYSFAELNALLDAVKEGINKFGNREYNTRDYKQKKYLRKAIKEYMHQHLKNEQQRIEYIQQLAQQFGCRYYKIPPEAETISLEQFLSLDFKFLSVMNHLWEHNFTDIEDSYYLKKNIQQGKEWLESMFSHVIKHHAMPYGLYSETMKELPEDKMYYLLDNRCPEGKIAKNIINRKSLILP